MKHFLFTALVLACAAAAASAQTTYLFENHDVSVPGPGWSQQKLNGAAQGWIQSADLRAWHEDEYTSTGTTDDRLISPTLNLAAAGSVYVHFYSELNWAQWLANNPNSYGDGENDLWVSIDNGQTWTEVWTDTRLADTTDWTTVDITAYAGNPSVLLAFRFYGTYAQEWWIDEILVDDSPANPLPPPVNWTVQLPTQFRALSQPSVTDDFEAYAGVLPPHMATTSVDSASGLPAAAGWCTIAGGTTAANSGVRSLEMGIDPANTGYYGYVSNALVIGFDGSAHASLSLRFASLNLGDEDDDFDGVWLSANGSSWYHVVGDYNPAYAAWQANTVDLSSYAAITRGPFYLMFAQKDDFAYNYLDGIGIDDVGFDSGGPAGPTLTKSGSCPGLMTVSFAECTPNRPVVILAGGPGTFTQANPNLPCLGLSVNIAAPNVVGVLTANGLGAASTTFNASAGVCGITVQGVDQASCTRTNAITL